MSHFSVHRRLLYCYFLITTITLFGIFHARIDEWSDKRNEKTFIEHFNFVLNVEANASVTTHDAMECAIECIKRNFCFSFNFAVYPGNNNCKLLRENKYTSSDKFHASPLYYHYSIVSPCEYNPCNNGASCRPLYGTDGFLCERVPGSIEQASPWIKLNKDEVCFGAQNDSYGNFTVMSNGTLITMKFVYLSGYVTCNKNFVPYGSHWACKKDSNIATIVTNAKNKVILPQDYQNKSFTLYGYHPNSSELVFNPLSPPLTVAAGEEFRIWYHEDFQDGAENDNAGETCTDVFGLYSD